MLEAGERPQTAHSTGPLIESMVAQIIQLPIRQLAGLRRISITRRSNTDEVVIGLLQRAEVPAHMWLSAADLAGWRFVAHAAAVLSGTSRRPAHRSGSSVGAALLRAGYSEARLLRLTSARGDALADHLRIAISVLAKAGYNPLDLATIKHLLEDAGERAEGARLLITRQYYGMNDVKGATEIEQ